MNGGFTDITLNVRWINVPVSRFDAFCDAKGYILQFKRASFAQQKMPFRNVLNVNVLYMR